MTYQPPQKVLEKYANVVVNFALGGGTGIKKGETVVVQCSEYAKPLYFELVKAIWKAGGHVISRYNPSVTEEHNLDHEFYKLAEDHQLDNFPAKYLKGIVEQADHSIYIECETNLHSMEKVDPKKIMRRNMAFKPYMDWRRDKEDKGKFTWTIVLYGTPAMAKEAGLSLDEYWKQIINACYLDKPNPVKEWKNTYTKLEIIRQKLNKLKIERVHVEGVDVDLMVKIGEKRRWMGGSGRNIPSFELFTSPDWRGTEGWIKFNQPLYRYGSLVTGIELEFKAGKVIWSKADKNEKVLKHMIASPNADKVGEFSLTDKRFSRITKFMAETLFDENMGGPNGNTHIALGASYADCFDGKTSTLNKSIKDKLGFNDSVVHTDIISTSPRTVTAYLPNGKTQVIYENGQFTL